MVSPLAPVDPLTGIEASRLTAYIHFPFCLAKCPYCDFASIASKEPPSTRYTDAMLREAELRGLSSSHVFDSIYFGGGTPSLWPPRELERVLRKLRVSDRAEVTLEANPGAADAERFRDYKALGINRLSIGVQSFQSQTLQSLGRAHDGKEAIRAFKAARDAGFENVSLDFIYGVQGQTLEQVRADAEMAVSLGPEHLSAYALTLELELLAEEVPLARQLRRGEVHLPDDDVVVEMQRTVSDIYARDGLSRYEISNYGREGFHSRHNAAYWTGGEYFALGAGATGRMGLRRYQNHRSAEKYWSDIEANRCPEAQIETLDEETLSRERISMGLRLTSGVRILGHDEVVKRFEKEGLLTVGERVRLTPRGMDLHSSIAAALM